MLQEQMGDRIQKTRGLEELRGRWVLKTKTDVDGRLSWEMERRWEIEEEEMVSDGQRWSARWEIEEEEMVNHLQIGERLVSRTM
ncbi:hypothetical protein Droror1_Dr00023321 [Drosera rotundifolia]